jgi:Fe-S cluster biogenesis protein NfuA
MTESLQGVVVKQKVDGSWQAVHEASGRITHGLSEQEALEAMRDLIGMGENTVSARDLTSDQFEGTAREIALYLEGPISDMLALHSGFARLEGFQDGLAMIRLGGGCQGCPSSRITLLNGVFRDLQEHFGEDTIVDVQPVLD